MYSINNQKGKKKNMHSFKVSISSALSGNKVVLFHQPHGSGIGFTFVEW